MRASSLGWRGVFRKAKHLQLQSLHARAQLLLAVFDLLHACRDPGHQPKYRCRPRRDRDNDIQSIVHVGGSMMSSIRNDTTSVPSNAVVPALWILTMKVVPVAVTVPSTGMPPVLVPTPMAQRTMLVVFT